MFLVDDLLRDFHPEVETTGRELQSPTGVGHGIQSKRKANDNLELAV